MNRRELLGALAGACVVWPGAGRATARVSATRVRPGALVTLRCPGADAYEVSAAGCAPTRVPAHGRCRAPRIRTNREWTVMWCTPLAGERPIGEPVAVSVLTVRVGYGA